MADIMLTPIDSSVIAAHGYDPESKTMRVQFKNGGVYDYVDVSPERYAAFTGNASAGRYFMDQIRPHHVGTKVTGKA